METIAAAETQRRVSPRVRGILLAGGLFWLAILAAVTYTSLGIRFPINGGGETFGLTQSLLRDGTFANPFEAGWSGPSAFLPPAYPLFRFVLMRIFEPHGLMSILIATLLLHGLHAALLPEVSRVLFGRAAPGLWGAALVIALPLIDVIHWEAIYVAVGLLIFYLCADRILEANGPAGFGRGLALGLFAALLLLTNPSSLLGFGPWLVALVWRRRGEPAVRRAAAGILLAAFLGCVPWTVRNYIQFGRLFFIRDNFGLVLYNANNDCAEPTLLENLRNGCNDRTNPMTSVAEVELVRRLGEVEYNRNRMSAAEAWIKRNPARFAQLTAGRFVDYWFPKEAYSFWLITALAIPGAIWMAKRRLWTSTVLLAVCVLYPLVYYVAPATPRYKYPILWVSLLQAGYLLTGAADRLRAFTNPLRKNSQAPAARRAASSA